MSPTLAQRTESACAQLTRYGGGVFDESLADLLDILTDINDDMWHDRPIVENVKRAKAILDTFK